MKKIRLHDMAILLSLLLMITCGGGDSNSSPQPTPPAVITISPAGISWPGVSNSVVFVTAKQNRQFSASITGISNTTPTWAIFEKGSQWSVDQTGLVSGPLTGGQGGDVQVIAADNTYKTQYMQSIDPIDPVIANVEYGAYTYNTKNYTGRVWFGTSGAGILGNSYNAIDLTTLSWTITGLTDYVISSEGWMVYFNATSGMNCTVQASMNDLGGTNYQTNLYSFTTP